MSKLDLFGEGDVIVDKNGKKTNAKSLSGKVVGLYFSASWCPPCRGFTPALANKYKEIHENGNQFEIVFLSSDRDKKSCNEYYANMPWKCLDFNEREIKEKLSREFKVEGIPTLVLLNSKGEVITTNGRSVIMTVPFKDLKDEASIASAENKAKDAKNKAAAGASGGGVSADYSALLLSSIVAAFVGNHMMDKMGDRVEAKAYRTFDEFYPFYLSQHADQMCRRLHIAGTSIIVMMFILDHRYFISIFPALLCGIGMCLATGHISHGLYEMFVMVSIIAGAGKLTFGSFSKARGIAIMMLIGYGFAWVGHFVYEQNRPATFIYPAYSLIGDFKLWYETVTGARPF